MAAQGSSGGGRSLASCGNAAAASAHDVATTAVAGGATSKDQIKRKGKRKQAVPAGSQCTSRA